MGAIAERYRVLGELGAGGMATVELGELVGPVGFSRLVAMKRLYPDLARDPELVAMFVDEARLAARVRHPNVVSTLDVVHYDASPGSGGEPELVLVLDYVHGDSLARLVRAGKKQMRLRPDLAAAIVLGLLHGLHAAHEAVGPGGVPLGIVHRDVSPENVLVGVDGIPRLADFGIAKARHRVRTTMNGAVRGKLPYMAPEQLAPNGDIDRRTDVYAASVVLWELLTGRVPLTSTEVAAMIAGAARPPIPPPSALNPDVGPELDAVVLRGMAESPDERFATAMEMAIALERAERPASQRLVAEWVREVGGEALERRARLIDTLERREAPAASAPSSSGAAGLATAPCSDGTLPEEATETETTVAGPPRVTRTMPLPIDVRPPGPSSIVPVELGAPAPSRKKRRAPVVAVMSFASLAVALGMSLRYFEPGAPAHASPPPPAAMEAPAAPVSDPADPVEPAEAPPPEPTEHVSRAVPARVPVSVKPKKRSAPPARSSTLDTCEVPFRVDEDGVRIPKPGCW